MIYKFRRDWEVIIGTVLSCVAMWGVFFSIAFFGDAPVGGLVAIGAVFALLCATGLRTPRYVYIEKDLIVVKFYLGKKILADIKSVRCVTRDELVGSFRLFGNDGFCGYTGWLRKKSIGTYYLMAVNKRELALVTLGNGRQYVINYPQELLENMQGKKINA